MRVFLFFIAVMAADGLPSCPISECAARSYPGGEKTLPVSAVNILVHTELTDHTHRIKYTHILRFASQTHLQVISGQLLIVVNDEDPQSSLTPDTQKK